MTRDEFIRSRLEEMTKDGPVEHEDFISSFVCSTLEILYLNSKFPVLVKETPEPAIVYDQLSADQIVSAMTHKINWLTKQEYINKFGTELPTDPILDSIARIWRTHEDYNSDWA